MQRRQALLPNASESTGHLVDTLRVLVSREFRIRYKGSFFGILWAILSPLGTVAIIQLVFVNILNGGIPHFSVFMYSALLPWVWFQTSVQTGATVMTDNRALVRTPFFSKPLLPWAITCTNFVLYLLALPVLLGLVLYNRVPLTRVLLLLPIIWMIQWILTLGFTVLIAAIAVLVRDVQHLIGVLLTFWFYLTPIFYDLKQLPPEAAGWMSLNPMAAIVSAYRDVTLYGQPPDWMSLGRASAASAGILIFSLLIFRALEDTFIDQA